MRVAAAFGPAWRCCAVTFQGGDVPPTTPWIGLGQREFPRSHPRSYPLTDLEFCYLADLLNVPPANELRVRVDLEIAMFVQVTIAEVNAPPDPFTPVLDLIVKDPSAAARVLSPDSDDSEPVSVNAARVALRSILKQCGPPAGEDPAELFAWVGRAQALARTLKQNFKPRRGSKPDSLRLLIEGLYDAVKAADADLRVGSHERASDKNSEKRPIVLFIEEAVALACDRGLRVLDHRGDFPNEASAAARTAFVECERVSTRAIMERLRVVAAPERAEAKRDRRRQAKVKAGNSQT